ncbi:hypothetical protein K438DRAFT_1977293 [Mycena galopus ATCC 62051]|nr:hypothetical protein K438DRAFT_1977293 [Mycena galopus ATCC 62051]
MSPVFYAFVLRHPTQSHIILQIATHLLGFIHIFSLSAIANLATRLRLRQGPVLLAQLRLWQSISSVKVAWNLPFLHAGIFFGYPLLHLLPASLWAGALAPISSQTKALRTFPIPSYPPDPTNVAWDQSSYTPANIF